MRRDFSEHHRLDQHGTRPRAGDDASWTNAGSPAINGIASSSAPAAAGARPTGVHGEPLEDHMAQQIDDDAADQGGQCHGRQRIGQGVLLLSLTYSSTFFSPKATKTMPSISGRWAKE